MLKIFKRVLFKHFIFLFSLNIDKFSHRVSSVAYWMREFLVFCSSKLAVYRVMLDQSIDKVSKFFLIVKCLMKNSDIQNNKNRSLSRYDLVYVLCQFVRWSEWLSIMNYHYCVKKIFVALKYPKDRRAGFLQKPICFKSYINESAFCVQKSINDVMTFYLYSIFI